MISQCLPATAGVTYWMSFRYKGRDDLRTYEGSCSVVFFPSANLDCLGSSLDPPLQASATSVGGAWSTSAAVASGRAPAGTASMSFLCSNVSFGGYYDQLYLGTATAPNF